jgi:FtsP/CotA-like multicopper oxidase with cupredoxin domain
VRQRAVTLAPAQRVDVIVSFADRAVGSTVQLLSAPFRAADVDPMSGGMGMGGMGGGGAAAGLALGAPITLMTFDIARREAERFVLSERLSTFGPTWNAAPDVPVRRIELSFSAGQWFLGGRTFDMLEAAPDETVRAGASQIWEVANVSGMMGMPMAHPLHIHGRQFRVLSRTRAGGASSSAVAQERVDAGWMDTVLILPNETVRLLVHFTRHPGLYLYHCHILEHEDLGMMRNYRVLPG